MVSRRSLLILSVLLSILLHSGMIAIAPSVPLLGGYGPSEELLASFKVRVIDEDMLPPLEEKPVEPENELATRTGSVEDLLERQPERLEPNTSPIDQATEVPELAERLAEEKVIREHDLDIDEAILKKVDARIIEISQDVARQDVQIARRVVRPSPMRILGENEFPTLRVSGEDLPSEILTIDPLNVAKRRSTGAGPGDGGGGKPEEEIAPKVEKVEVEPELPEPVLPALPEVSIINQADVINEVTEESTYEFLDDLLDIEIATYSPGDGTPGYFRLRLVPKKGENIEVLPKDITFVVDASNSIVQRKLDQTVRGLKSVLQELRPEDRFNVVAFRDTPTAFHEGLVPASPDAKSSALDFVADLESHGETDVYRAIRPVVLDDPRPGLPGIVVVVTDGRPTAGIKDGRTIINSLTAENDMRNSIFAFGGGNTVNRYMLDLLAYRNKGEAEVAERIDEIGQDLPQFYERFSDPILVDCKADYGRVDEQNVFPKALPDFFKGQGVTVYGRYDPAKNKEFAMRLTGVAGQRKKEIVFKADLQEAQTGDKAIARDWAFRRIYFLIGEICRIGETPELLAEIRHLGKTYGISTSYDR